MGRLGGSAARALLVAARRALCAHAIGPAVVGAFQQFVEFFGRLVPVAVVDVVLGLPKAAFGGAVGQGGQGHGVAQTQRKRRELLHRRLSLHRRAAQDRTPYRAPELHRPALGAGIRQRALRVLAAVCERADIDVKAAIGPERDFLERVGAVIRQLVKHCLGLDRLAGGRHRRAPDTAGLANVDLRIGPVQQCERAVKFVGQHVDLGALCGVGRRLRRQAYLQQPALALHPAAHVDDPQAPGADFQHPAGRAQAVALIGYQGHAGAGRAGYADLFIAAAAALGRIAPRVRQRRPGQQGAGQRCKRCLRRQAFRPALVQLPCPRPGSWPGRPGRACAGRSEWSG